MSRTIADETKRGVRIQINEVEPEAWRAILYVSGRMFVIDYAPSDEKRGANPDGSPTVAMVRDAWREDRDAFREV